MRRPVVALAALLLLLPLLALAQRRRVLTDSNFEHVTQAATGQTTGIWFVNFCSPTAKNCKALVPLWEELGREMLQRQLFVTTVDVHASPLLAQRFAITSLPTLLLFRDRKVCARVFGAGVGGRWV